MTTDMSQSSRNIVFTGGGSGGHVFPNKPLVDHYKSDFVVHYIGTKNGVEREMTKGFGVVYHSIQAGKLRRYIDVQNVIDVVRFCVGVVQAVFLIARLKPVFIFSKGGFVSVSVCIAGWLLRTPVYIHEADRTPGLANRIASRFATHVFLTFPPVEKPKYTYTVSGLPLRSEIYSADALRGKTFLGITDQKPVLLVLGGSLGASNINKIVRDNISKLTEQFTVVHSTGNGKLDGTISIDGYIQREFIGKEIFDCIAAADVVLSRAGAGSIMELLTLQKPTIFIPLGLDQSRGDQIENCEYLREHDVGVVLMEEDMTNEKFISSIKDLVQKREQYKSNIQKLNLQNAAQVICRVIDTEIKK